MSAPTFLKGVRKFVVRRETPALVVSDNAKTFKASTKYLKKLYSDSQVRYFFTPIRLGEGLI